MLKVAIIDHVGQKAGMDLYTSSLAQSLAKQGIETDVFSNFVAPDRDYVNHRVFASFIKNPVQRLFSICRGFVKATLYLKKARTSHALVHLFSADLYLVLLFAMVKLGAGKLIVISHDSENYGGREFRMLRRLIYNKLAQRVIVHNRYSYESIVSEFKDARKLEIIKHGSFGREVSSGVTKAAAREEYELQADELLVLFFGQIKKVKRLDVFLEAVECRPNIRYHVAGRIWKGDFTHYQEIIDRRATACLRVDLGYVSNIDRDRLFKAADIVVLPYDQAYQSGVLLLAMSYGLCVIASDIAAFREIIESGKNGILFERGNASALRSAIEKLQKDQKLRASISSQGRKFVEQEYSWDKIALHYTEKVLL